MGPCRMPSSRQSTQFDRSGSNASHWTNLLRFVLSDDDRTRRARELLRYAIAAMLIVVVAAVGVALARVEILAWLVASSAGGSGVYLLYRKLVRSGSKRKG